MKGWNLIIFLLFLCFLNTQAQTNPQWVPGTMCLNCPSTINAPKFNTAQVANGNNTLVTTYTQSACGLNFTHASLPLFKRNFSALGSTVSATQPAPFVISGIPPCGYVLKAFLYSDASGGNIPVTVSVTNSSSSVTATFSMTNIGTCADKCWGYGGSQSYRADVTSLVSGNGTYSIIGFPVMPQSPNYDTDGATLFVIYADPSQNWTGSIVIADGCMGISGTVNSVISGFSACDNSSVTTGFGLIGDLQRIANTNFRFNSTTNNFVKTQASDQVWDCVIGAAANATIGQTSANFGVSTSGDCYNFVMTGMHYRTNCLTCGSSGGSITAVTSNSASICAGSSATLIASPPANYTWNPGGVVGTSIVVTPNNTTYYSASILNSTGCGFATSPVIVNPAPSLTLTPSAATVCPGQTSLINCNGAGTYTLFPGSLIGNPIAVNPTVATVYTVAGTATTGCSNSNTVSVKVYTVAPVVASYTSPLCSGGTLSLTASSAATYTWNGPGNYIYYFQNPVITNATYSNTGIYTVSVYDSHQCLNSTTLNVIVNPQQPVTPTVAPFGLICNTTPPFNLSVVPLGGGWIGNSGVSNAGVVTPALVPQNTISSAVYTVYVGPCLNSITINIDASTFYSAALTNSVPNLCETDAPFNLTGIVQNTVNGTWVGAGVGQGPPGNFFFNPSTLPTGIYTCTYSTVSSPKPNACPANSTLNVSVTQTVVPLIVTPPEFCNNQPSFTLTANPSGGVWYGNSGVTALGVVVPSLSVLSNSLVNYSVTVGPCKNYGSTVIKASRFNTAALNNNMANICVSNNPVNLMSYVQSTVNGLWTGPGVNTFSFVPAGLPTNTYLLTYSCTSFPNPTLCPDASIFTMTVLNPAVPNITSTGPYCSKDAPVQMSVTPNTGSWSPTSYLTPSGVLIPSLCTVGNNAVNYIVGTSTCFAQQTKNILVEAYVPATIVNAIPDLCNTGSPMNLMPITLSNSGIWQGPGISGTSFDPAVTGAGNFVLLYKTSSIPSGLCPDQSTVAVTVHSLAIPVVTPAGPFCSIHLPQKLIVSPVGGFFSGLNNSAITSSGLFNPAFGIIGSNVITYGISKGPCIAYAQTTINVQKFINADFEKLVYSFCKTDNPFDLSSLVKNPGGVWSGPGMTGSIFNPSLANPGNSNLISYTATSAPNTTLCPDTSSIRINIDEIPKIELKSITPGGCIPFEAVLTISPQGMGGMGEWIFDDGTDKQEGLVGNHIYNSPGSYTVVFSYSLGSCHTIATLANPIIVHEKPNADFNIEPDEITMSAPNATLNNLSTVLGNNKYEWLVAGVGKYNDVVPEINFNKAGTYNVTLTATSIYGCKDVVTKAIEVKNDFAIYFPNCFTPNYDGINDLFMPFSTPYGLDPNGFEMEIFDRWGHSLFLTNDINKGWNGTLKNKGTEVEKEGVYVYKVRYKDLAGQLYHKVGSFTLLHK